MIQPNPLVMMHFARVIFYGRRPEYPHVGWALVFPPKTRSPQNVHVDVVCLEELLQSYL